MSKQTEALKLALEALKEYALNEGATRAADKAIAAIEAVLPTDYRAVKTYHEGKPVYVSQPAQEPVMGTKTWFEDGKVVTQHLTAKDIYKEPEQEPEVCCGGYATCTKPCTPRGRWLAEHKPILRDIEQYRLQMAGISTAAIGYWKEGDGVHPDYDTTALRDVAKLYSKYDALYKARWEINHD